MGIPSGFKKLDALMGGFQRSDLIIFAGRPGMGKTAFLLTVAMNMSSLANANVAIFTLEMGVEQLVQRYDRHGDGHQHAELTLGEDRQSRVWAVGGGNRKTEHAQNLH
jgi:replicative DNA helicase